MLPLHCAKPYPVSLRNQFLPTILRTKDAHWDLVDIATEVGREDPTAADRLLDMMEEKCHILAQFPSRGRRREEFGEGMRSFPVGNYLIFYRNKTEGIQVIRI